MWCAFVVLSSPEVSRTAVCVYGRRTQKVDRRREEAEEGNKKACSPSKSNLYRVQSYTQYLIEKKP